MLTLGIETSCDETGAALVTGGKIISSAVSSSVKLHEKYGGVVPEIASRFHIEFINQVVKKALAKARLSERRGAAWELKKVKLIAVTEKPGLPGSLIAGVSYARALSYALGIPLIAVDHIFAHLYANFLDQMSGKIDFPFLGIVISGGHTNIFLAKDIEELAVIGKTRDDAIGEAFDKVAKILKIGYPGGPRIERYAKMFTGDKPIDFPRAYLGKDSFDFSLSGIKTAVLYHARDKKIDEGERARISWSFQEAVFDVVVEKIERAVKKFSIKTVLLGGGVICNMTLREKLKRSAERADYRVLCPQPSLCLDNAAMVAGLGEALYKRRK